MIDGLIGANVVFGHGWIAEERRYALVVDSEHLSLKVTIGALAAVFEGMAVELDNAFLLAITKVSQVLSWVGGTTRRRVVHWQRYGRD